VEEETSGINSVNRGQDAGGRKLAGQFFSPPGTNRERVKMKGDDMGDALLYGKAHQVIQVMSVFFHGPEKGIRAFADSDHRVTGQGVAKRGRETIDSCVNHIRHRGIPLDVPEMYIKERRALFSEEINHNDAELHVGEEISGASARDFLNKTNP